MVVCPDTELDQSDLRWDRLTVSTRKCGVGTILQLQSLEIIGIWVGRTVGYAGVIASCQRDHGSHIRNWAGEHGAFL